MKERLYYDIPEEMNKKELAEALKNEFKINKHMPIFNKNGEMIAEAIKYILYTNHLDFYLEDDLNDDATETPGKVYQLEIIDDELKNKKIKRLGMVVG